MEESEKKICSVPDGPEARKGEPSTVEAPASDRCPYCGFRSGFPHELLVHIFQCHPG